MKTDSKKVKLLSLLFVSLMGLCIAFAVGFGTKTAKADAPVFEFETGAYVKISGDGGMRFRLKMDASTANTVKTGGDDLIFYVGPKARMDTYDALSNTYEDMVSANKIWKAVADKSLIYQGFRNGLQDGFYYSNVLLDINTLDSVYRTIDFQAVAVCGARSASSVDRNLYKTANDCALDSEELFDSVKSIYGSWLGASDTYKLYVTTDEQYEVLAAKIEDNAETYFYLNDVDDNSALIGAYSNGSGIFSDASDKDAIKHLFATGSPRWNDATTSAEIVRYSALVGITKPDGVEGETLIKYTHVNPNSNVDPNVDSIPLRYANGNYDFNTEQKALDFSKAVLSFYIYNANNVNMSIYFGYNIGAYPHVTNKGSATAVKGGWTKIEVDLSEFDIDVTDSYEVFIFVGAFDLTTDGIFYIDDVTFYEREAVDASDKDAIKHLCAAGSPMWNDATTTAEIVRYSALDGIIKPDGVAGETLIKYTHVNPNSNVDPNVDSIPLRYANGNYDFNTEQKALDFSKAVLSFYIYNANNVNMSIYFGYNIGAYPHVTNKGSATAVKGEWTKIEVDLSAFNIDVTDSYEVFIFVGAFDLTTDGIFYIDDVTFYEVDA